MAVSLLDSFSAPIAFARPQFPSVDRRLSSRIPVVPKLETTKERAHV